MEGFLCSTPEYCMLVNKTWLIPARNLWPNRESDQTAGSCSTVWSALSRGAWDIMEVPRVGIYSRLGVGVKDFLEEVVFQLRPEAWLELAKQRTFRQRNECVQRLEEKMEHGFQFHDRNWKKLVCIGCVVRWEAVTNEAGEVDRTWRAMHSFSPAGCGKRFQLHAGVRGRQAEQDFM